MVEEMKKCAACEEYWKVFPQSWWSVAEAIGLIFLGAFAALLFLFTTGLPMLLTGLLTLVLLLIAGTILCKFIRHSVIGQGFYFFADKDDQFHSHPDKPFRDEEDKPYWNSAIKPDHEIPGAILWISTSKFRKPKILPKNEKNWIPTRIYFTKCTGNYATWMIELGFGSGVIKTLGAASPRVRVEIPSALRLINSATADDFPIFSQLNTNEQELKAAREREKELRNKCADERFFGDFVYRVVMDIAVGCKKWPKKSQILQAVRMYAECLQRAQMLVASNNGKTTIQMAFETCVEEQVLESQTFREFVALVKIPDATETPAPEAGAGA
ncbi:MAG: hypothetical protein V1902_00970 [Candidatus Falkowbacteria bacterium]